MERIKIILLLALVFTVLCTDTGYSLALSITDSFLNTLISLATNH